MNKPPSDPKYDSAGAWAKKYHLASRVVMEATLRSYGLGSTQWYVLWQLANVGPTAQRELLILLRVEKPTLSEVVRTLVHKGLVEQTQALVDQRQRVLKLTPQGAKLWQKLPDPIELIQKVAFDRVRKNDLATVVRVLKAATQRLNNYTANTTNKKI